MKRRNKATGRIATVMIAAAIGMGCFVGTVLSPSAVIEVRADEDNGQSAEDAKNTLSSYCSNLKMTKKPDKYASKQLDAILSNAVSYLNSEPDINYASYVSRVEAQMDAVMNSTVGAGDTANYLFLADNFEIPTVKYGETATIILPIINYSDARLSNVVIDPDMSDINTDKFPFEIQNTGYTQMVEAIPPFNAERDILELRQDVVYTFQVRQDVQTGYYPIKFNLLYTRNNTMVEGEIVTYINVIGKPEYGIKGQNEPKKDEEEEDKFVPQPRIIVTGFETSPQDVYAGDTFTVYIHVKNTSSTMAVKNVLFDMQAAVEGSDKTNTYSAFLPTSGSSSVYMEQIGPNQEKDIEIEMTAKADLAQKPYVLEVNMKYDYDKTANVSDTASVSIPIKQESRFDTSSADVAPTDVAVGSQTNVMFSIYNVGKTTLYNVQVKFKEDCVEGGDAFIGNLTSGSTGNVDTMLTAVSTNDTGFVTAIISYEDDTGEVTEFEKEISLNIYEESYEDFPAYDPGMEMVEPEQTGLPKGAIIGIVAGAVAAVIILIVVIVKIRKKKKAKKQLEEDLSFIDEE